MKARHRNGDSNALWTLLSPFSASLWREACFCSLQTAILGLAAAQGKQTMWKVTVEWKTTSIIANCKFLHGSSICPGPISWDSRVKGCLTAQNGCQGPWLWIGREEQLQRGNHWELGGHPRQWLYTVRPLLQKLRSCNQIFSTLLSHGGHFTAIFPFSLPCKCCPFVSNNQYYNFI